MTRARSIHIGAGRFVDGAYGHPPPPLPSAADDAIALRDLCRDAGFAASLILDEGATLAAVRAAIEAAHPLAPGSRLVITYSGHGALLRRPAAPIAPTAPTKFEATGKDQAWCLADGFLIDDELHRLLGGFGPGVGILVISDSCHSGTMLDLLTATLPGRGAWPFYRQADAQASFDAMWAHTESVPMEAPEVRASVIHFGACADEAQAWPGVFTGAIVTVWDHKAFDGSHRRFFDQVAQRTAEQQDPVWTTDGPTDPGFEASRPFTPPPAEHAGPR